MTFTHALSTNNYGPAKFIVSASAANGTHTTIATALTAASSGDTIFIRPGTYTEDITLKAGVNLSGYGGDGFTPNIIILGNTTASYNGTVTLTGLQLKTNSAACLTVSGSNTSTLILNECNVDGNNSTAMSINAASFSLSFTNCRLQTESNNLLFAVTTSAGISFQSCELSSGTAASTVAAGAVSFYNCKASIFSITTSSTGSFNIYNSFFNNSSNQTIFTTAGTGTSIINNSKLLSGTSSAISIGSGTTVTTSLTDVNSSNTNVITGAGTLNYIGLSFSGSSTLVNPTTIVGVGLPSANGAAGTVLTSNGAGLIPTFQAAGGGGGTGTLVTNATTSGTSFNVTVANTSTYIVMAFAGIQLSAGDLFTLQLGTAGGLVTSGYAGRATSLTAPTTPWSTFAQLNVNSSSTNPWSGSVTLTLVNSSTNVWGITVVLIESTAAAKISHGGGYVTLTNPITQLQLANTGASTFTTGSLGVLYRA